MRAATWWRLMWKNGFRVTPTRVPMSMILAVVTPANDVLATWQHIRFGKKLQKTELTAPPLFIIGHWRSGTTLLHELLMLDPRLVCPDTYQCFAPCHFLVSGWLFRNFGRWLLPNKRPMDNVAAGWDRPQEDEFALMNLGLPSPYRRIAFPRNEIPDLDYLDLRQIPPAERASWLQGLERFLKAITVAQAGRVVLKSPTHTGRIGLLSEHFPGAKFLHITRDPRSLFPSTLKMWRSLDATQGLQKPTPEPDKQYVLSCFEKMYRAFHRDRDSVPKENLLDIRYEDLVAEPEQTLRRVYQELDLGDFEPLEAPLKGWIEQHHRGYQVNQHALLPADEAAIHSRWAEYFDRYGYPQGDSPASPAVSE